MKIRVKRFDKKFPLPSGEAGAAAFDLTCRETVTIAPNKIKAIPLNIALQVPEGYVLLLFARSSTSHKLGLLLANGVGVVDPFYCGDDDENLAFFLNVTDKPVTVKAGDRVAQGIIMKTETVDWVEVEKMGETGHGGYHHTESLQ